MSRLQGQECTTSQQGLDAPLVGSKSCEMEVLEEYFHVAEEARPLDEKLFPHFKAFIHACQTYASLSGCRFSISAFDGIQCDSGTCLPVVSDIRAKDDGPLLAAKLRAVRHVKDFANRLKNGEPYLLEDLTRAFHLVMKETARNSMIAYCKAEDFFPPLPAPSSVDDKDCSWDEVGLASAPVIAQRLYNDEVHRANDAEALVLAKTASFVVEFADEVGVELPTLPPERTNMLQQFQQDLASWTSMQTGTTVSASAEPQDDSWMRAATIVVPVATAVLSMAVAGMVGHAAARAVQGSVRTRTSRTAFGHRMNI